MSLLNDALKRAENVRPDASAFANPPALQPVTLSRSVSQGTSFLLPLLILLVLLLSGFFLWQWRIGAVQVRARSRLAPLADAIKPRPAPTEPPPKTNLPADAAMPALAPPSNAPSLVSSLSTKVTNWIAAVTPARQAEYKLQSIFYLPQRPSAMINGETLFIGDRLQDATLTAVGTNSATLTAENGQIQVLELP